MSITLKALCTQLGIPVPAGKEDIVVTSFKPLHEAGPSDISFFDNQLYKHGARSTMAAAVLIRERDANILPETCIPLLTPSPYVAFARALQVMYPAPVQAAGVSQFAVVSASAKIHPTARIEPYAVIYEGAVIGSHCHIGAHAVIGQGVTIGSGSTIGAHATLQKATVGAGCIIHPGVRIGQDGFGFAIATTETGPTLIKVPQIGQVRIGNEVEIGANTTIDCGALGDTVLEDMVKIDNQVQIGHNAKLGRGTRIVAQAAIAGSAALGQFNVVGGQSGVSGHTVLADRVMVAARSGVTKSITTVGSVVAGMPAVPINEWRKTVAVIARLTKNVLQKPSEIPGATASEDTEN